MPTLHGRNFFSECEVCRILLSILNSNNSTTCLSVNVNQSFRKCQKFSLKFRCKGLKEIEKPR